MKKIARPRLLAIILLCFPLFIHSVAASPVIIAHRGYSSLAPENTISSIVTAAPFSWGVEIDIRETADGEYILMHNASLDGTTNGTGNVSSRSFNYIRGLDAGSWKSPVYAGEQVPTVLEAIDVAMANDLKLCIELKAAMPADMFDILTPYSDYIEVHSFNEGLLQSIANLGGDFTYVLLGRGNTLNSKVGSLQPCIDKVSWESAYITQWGIDTLHTMDKQIYAWTVDNTSTALSLANKGVDAIITNNPEALRYAVGYEPETVSYPCRLKDNLAAHWAFDEGLTNPTTRTAVDSSGNGSDATFTSTLAVPSSWKTGSAAKVGGAIELDGVNDTTTFITSSALAAPKRGVTIATWVKLDKLPTQMSSSHGCIYDPTENTPALYLDKGAGELRMQVLEGGSTARPGIPQSMLDTSGWHYVVGVYDGGAGTAQIYLDGQMVDIEADGAYPLTGLISSQIATIGSGDGSYNFDGKLDEMSFWGRALGQAEIGYLYNQGQGRAMPERNVFVGAPTPVVQYKFEGNYTNSGSGGVSYDATLSNGNGTTTFVTGVEGNQALDVSNAHASMGGDYLDTSYRLTETGAITFWCKPSEYYNYNTLFDISTGFENDWEMWVYGTGEARFRIDGDSYVSCQLDDIGEWNNIAVTWAKTGSEVLLNIFLDGVLQDFDRGAWIDPAGTLSLLGGNSGNMHGNATLDDFRVYDSLLTSDEIMSIYLQKEQPRVTGDANNDGKVDGSDVAILAGNWQTPTGATLEMGDFNNDGAVDGSDVAILAGNWQFGVHTDAMAVPEPSVIVLLLSTTLFGVLVRELKTSGIFFRI